MLGAGEAGAGMPTDQIKGTVDKALTVLRDPRFKPPAKLNDRRDQLRQILFARFDFTEMARRALGANWRRRTPQEQDEFVRLFTDVLERAYAGISSPTPTKKSSTSASASTASMPMSSKIVTGKGEEYRLTTKLIWSAMNGRYTTSLRENISLVNDCTFAIRPGYFPLILPKS